MRICLNPYVEGSGIGTYILELANYLAENTEHEIIAIGDTKLAHHPKIKVYQTPKKNSFWTQVPPISWFYFVWEDFLISRLVNSIRPDVFHTSDNVVFNTIKCPTVQVGWDYPRGPIDCIKLTMSYERRWLLPYRILRELEMGLRGWYVNKTVTKVLGVTKHVTSKLYSNGVFIPPGINIRKNDEKRSDKFTITFVARNHLWIKRKGLRFLLDALMLIESDKVEYDLVLIGNVPKGFESVLQKYDPIKRHIQIKGLLPRAETLKLIKRSHFLAAPSLYEEFGFAIIEAMSYGIPIIASNGNESFKEMIGAGGICVDIKNAKLFSLELHKLIMSQELLKKLSENAISQISKNYSWDKIIPDILKLYKETI